MVKKKESKIDINIKGFNAELYKAIRVQAAKEDRTIKGLITKVMREYIAKKQKDERQGR